jgi:Predicted phosphatases
MIGAGARKLIERGLELEGRMMGVEDVNRLTKDFIDYYAAHIADASRPFEGLEAALDQLAARAAAWRCAPTSWNGCRSGCSTNWA